MKKTYLLICNLFLTALSLVAQNYQINSTNDDAEESAGFAIVSLSSPIIDLTSDPTDTKFMKQIVGLRFNNIQVEKGAPLSNCYLAFHVDQPSTKNSMLTIKGEKTANAQAFQAVNQNLSSRSKTKTVLFWNNVEIWNRPGEIMKSIDISNILIEITSQPEWKPGNSIVLFIEGYGQRHATAYDKNPEFAVQLVLNDAAGSNYRRPEIIQTEVPVSNPVEIVQTPPVNKDICNIPEPPVGISKQAFMQGETYMKNSDFTSAESRFTMAIDNLKHPKYFIYRAASRQLLDRFADAQNDLNQAIALGIDPQMVQKCFNDLVDQYKNFEEVGNMFPFCFNINVRGFFLPPCPMHVSISDGSATLIATTRYEKILDKPGTFVGKSYTSLKIIYNWGITPGNFHPCNPNVTAKFMVSENYKPTNKDYEFTAKTAGWFEIPIKLNYQEIYLDKEGKEVESQMLKEDWVFVGWLAKFHTGETTVYGQTIGANGKSSGGLRVE